MLEDSPCLLHGLRCTRRESHVAVDALAVLCSPLSLASPSFATSPPRASLRCLLPRCSRQIFTRCALFAAVAGVTIVRYLRWLLRCCSHQISPASKQA